MRLRLLNAGSLSFLLLRRMYFIFVKILSAALLAVDTAIFIVKQSFLFNHMEVSAISSLL